jgi:hypothetical protein
MVREFSAHDLQSDHWVIAVEDSGARVIG